MSSPRTRVRIILLFLGGLLACSAPRAGAPAAAQQPPVTFGPPVDEFVGPFPSWTNVKTAYGAVGDGKADDTAALQRALNDLRQNGHSPVLFLPSGTYRITSTVELHYALTVALVGADPDTVTLRWDGPPGGTMLWVNAVAYSRMSRITFDGRGTAGIAIDQTSDGKGGNFDTGNEYADNRYVDVGFGIRGGFMGGGFAETSIVRNRFIRNTKAGVALGNFNALDIWVWDSLFDHCEFGVTNEPGAGNYRVYDSVFRGSRTADLYMQNTGSFTARDNFSSGSGAFYLSRSPLNHPAVIDIHHNTILDTQQMVAVRLSNQGPGLVLDNVIRSRAGAIGPVISWTSMVDADVESIGNTFTVTNPVVANGRLVEIDDRTVPIAQVKAVEPALPAPAPATHREVFEVPPGAETATIQRAIDQAASHSGTRPVVHLPFGNYKVTATLVVPPSDVQIVGDGFDTRLSWNGGSTGPLLRLAGPTSATLRNLMIQGTAAVDGIVATGVDTPGSRVWLDGVEMRSGAENGLWVDGLDNATVQMTDVGHANSTTKTSIRVTAGPRALRGEATDARTTIFSGASSNNGLSYDFAGPVTAVIRDIWYEGSVGTGFALIRDGARVTFQGVRVAVPADAKPPTIAIANPRGRTSLLSSHIDDRIAVSGAGPTDVLGLGLMREFRRTPFVDDTSTPPGTGIYLNARQRAEVQGTFSIGTSAIADRGTADAAFIRRMLADTRAVVSPSRGAVPAGASDLRIIRVSVNDSRTDVLLQP